MADVLIDRLREATVDERLLDPGAIAAAAKAASSALGRERAIALVQAAHNRPLAPGGESDLRARLNSDGEVLPGAADDQLLAVLAAEALIISFSRVRGGGGLLPALAVRCAEHAGWPPVHPDVRTSAGAYLERRSALRRARHSLDHPLQKEKPKSEGGTPERLSEEHDALRDYVQHDRERLWERDQIAWWAQSARRPADLVALVNDFAKCLRFLPAPIAAPELIAAKVALEPSEEGDTLALPVPHELVWLCPDLTGNEGSPSEHEPLPLAFRLLDQVLLLRAYEEVGDD